MQQTEHARDRLSQRHIGEWQLDMALEHGEWNARGDRLMLGERNLRNLIADRRRSLRRIEREQYAHGTKDDGSFS
jgi:hypothetical protein